MHVHHETAGIPALPATDGLSPEHFAMQNYPFSSNSNEKIVKFVSYFVSHRSGKPAEDAQWTENRLKYASGNSGTSSMRTTAGTMWL